MPKKAPAAPVGRRRSNDPALDAPQVPADPLAAAHRAADAPALTRWVDDMLAILPDGALTHSDVTDLSACGAGMSVWQRGTVLRLLKKCTE